MTLENLFPFRTLAQGLWIYIFDEASGNVWSSTGQPSGNARDDYRVLFHPHLAEFQRREQQILSTLEVAVASRIDLETRRLVIVNESTAFAVCG